MKKVLIGVIIAAIVVIGGVAIYENSSSKASNSASQNTIASEGAVSATINKVNTDTPKKDISTKASSVPAEKSVSIQDAKASGTQNVKTESTQDAKAGSIQTKASGTVTAEPEKASNAIKTTNSTTNVKESQSAPAITQKTDANKSTNTTSVIGPNQINQGTGNFSGLNNYPFMVATLSNGQQVIIPIKNAQKEGNLLVTNGYYTNNIYAPVQFKISSLGKGAYNFYQMQNGGILSDFSVNSQGGSQFTGNNIDTIGNDDESVGIQGIYQGPEQDGYYPGSMLYHPFYNGTVNGENVTFVNLGNNNYLEYKEGNTSPCKITVTWNPFPNVNMQLDESVDGTPIGRFDITSFVYGSNTYSGDYFHYIGHTKAGVESRFSISGGYSPK